MRNIDWFGVSIVLIVGAISVHCVRDSAACSDLCGKAGLYGNIADPSTGGCNPSSNTCVCRAPTTK